MTPLRYPNPSYLRGFVAGMLRGYEDCGRLDTGKPVFGAQCACGHGTTWRTVKELPTRNAACVGCGREIVVFEEVA